MMATAYDIDPAGQPDEQPESVEPAMTDDELASMLQQHATQAVGEEWGEIASQQEKAIDYYYRRMPDLPAEDGTSSVVADTVQVTVDDAMAEILRPFVSAEEFATFEPVGPEDEETAAQANEYVNYVLHCDNPGFVILHNWFKDSLLTKLGIVKVWWKDTSSVAQHVMDAAGLLQARGDQNYQGEQDNGDGSYTVALVEPDGRCVIDCIPPEEFKISPFARSIEEASYSAHAPSTVTRSDLVEMGYDAELVYGLPTWTGSDSPGENTRRDARYRDEGFGAGDKQMGMPHASQEIVAFREEFIRIDYDGDGIAELRKVHRVQDVILLNEEVDDNPFATLCPKPMPHKVYGLSLADDTLDLQRIETVLWRQTLDNLYKSNNPRPIIGEASERNDGSTQTDLADNAPGAAIRVRVYNEFGYAAVPFTADKSFPMMQLVEQKRAARTGFQSLGNGLDRDVLQQGRQMTATQASQVEDKQNSRAEMIARIFAETGVKRLMKLILHNLVRHQPKARVIRLRNQWVEIDPKSWNPEMDLTINVGLGVGNKADQINQASALLEGMERLAPTPYGSLITEENVYKAFKRFVQAVGVKNVDDYVTEPDPNQPKPEKPDPEMEKVKGEQMMQAAKQQADQQAMMAKLELQRQETDAKLEMQHRQQEGEMQLARERALFEASLAEQKAQQEMALAEQRMAMEEDMAERKASLAESTAKLPTNRPGGSLAE